MGLILPAKKWAETNYRKLAYKDSLTRLANRAMFIDRVDHHLALLNRRGGDISSCLLLIDLDNFKVTNDTLGHGYGDRLLQAVGERLLKCSRASDTVARLGGDEFVVLAEGANDIYDIQVIAEKIIETFKQPVDIGSQKVQVELSMGALPIVPKAYVNTDDVLRDADIAMYRAKKVNGSYWVIFNEELDASARRMRQLQIDFTSKPLSKATYSFSINRLSISRSNAWLDSNRWRVGREIPVSGCRRESLFLLRSALAVCLISACGRYGVRQNRLRIGVRGLISAIYTSVSMLRRYRLVMRVFMI